MLERYWAWNYEIKDLGLWPGEGYKGHNMPVEVVKAEDAQATIADLQGQVKEAQERLSLCEHELGSVRIDRAILQQRVAQLEADNRTYINERHENMKTIETLQADHARVLELVQECEYEIKRRIWQMHGSRMGHQLYGDDGRLDCNTCFRKYSDESLETVCGFEIYDANILFAKAASLPAQPAQEQCSYCKRPLTDNHSFSYGVPGVPRVYKCDRADCTKPATSQEGQHEAAN